MSTEPPSLFVGIPAYGGIDGMAFLSHMGLTALFNAHRIPLTFHVKDNCGDIVRIRNGILAAFMRSNLSHLLMVDADVAFEPQAVLRMLQSGHEFVGGAVPMRRLNFDGLKASLAGEMSPPSADRLRSRLVHFNLEPDTSSAHGAFIPVKAIGTALLLVARKAVEKMAAAYPELEHVDTDGSVQIGLFNHVIDKKTRRILGEDISFCRRHTALGGVIYCLTDCAVAHTGPISLRGNLKDVDRNIVPYTQATEAV